MQERQSSNSTKTRMGLLFLAVLLGALFWWSVAQAGAQHPLDSENRALNQNEETCKAECDAQAQQCFEICGEHSDPVECESDCRSDAQQCSRDCR